MRNRYVCIHGHFYQPPREHPWLEAVERQESAEPYHDWNERIAAESYAPNARSRILDGDGRISRIVNNYGRISFNVGPTLLSWLEQFDPATYAAVLAADRDSAARFGGHGSALAQVYNHAIMPLCNARDQRTQVRWGVADFRRRFGRSPEGMWLAETAVDAATLEVLADAGIKFTVLSPFQADGVRALGSSDWEPTEPGRIDPTRPYLVLLPSGGTIAVFFYDGPISQAIAFEGLLKSGEKLAARLVGPFPETDDGRPRLVNIATDGETYGHHARHGDMALAYALEQIESQKLATLTNYGEHLERFPPTLEARVREASAWSCAHGVGRWSRDCGCRFNGDWHQQWRGPLRDALDALRDRLAPLYETGLADLFADPWAARDDYVRVILDRDPAVTDGFLRQHAGRNLSAAEAERALKWLEVQRNALLMYTSCGWFFDDISGIETVQVLAYAGRAIHLAEELSGAALEDDFAAALAAAPSNLPDHGDGRRVYERVVKPMRVDLPKVAAHYAVSSLFEDYPARSVVFAYDAELLGEQRREARKARLTFGRVRVTSRVTRETAEVAYAAAHFGELNLRGGVCPLLDREAEAAAHAELDAAFTALDMPEVIGLLDRHYHAARYSLRSLFRDEKQSILRRMLEATAADLEDRTRQVYEAHAATMQVLRALDAPLPLTFRNAAYLVINHDLRIAFAAARPDLSRVRDLLDDAAAWGVSLDRDRLAYRVSKTVAALFDAVADDPDDQSLLLYCNGLLDAVAGLGFEVDLWRAQNRYHALLADRPHAARDEAFGQLGWKLGMRVG